MLIGASGSGKSVLAENLMNEYKGEFETAISYTTRERREGEINGVHYHFVSEEEFGNVDMIESVRFGDSLYGLSSDVFYKSNKDILLVVEPNGASQILEYIDAHSVDIVPLVIFMDIPPKTCEENMRKRGDSEEIIQNRLSFDTIRYDFDELGLDADKKVKKLTKSLHKDVYEFIHVFKLNF
jgi:guanylate kinase